MSYLSSIIIDDRDPSIHYLPTDVWYLAGSESEYNSSTHATLAANAVFSLTFRGVAIGVYGTSRAGNVGPSSRYSVDGGPAVQFRPPPLEANAYFQPFFQSSVLDDGQHSLMMTLDTQGIPYYFDYFNITQEKHGTSNLSDELSTVPTSAFPTPGTTTSISCASTSTQNPSSTTPTDPVANSAPSDRARLIGGVVGGLSGLLLALALVAGIIIIRQKQIRHITAFPYGPGFPMPMVGHKRTTPTPNNRIRDRELPVEDVVLGIEPPSYRP